MKLNPITGKNTKCVIGFLFLFFCSSSAYKRIEYNAPYFNNIFLSLKL